MKRIEDNGIVIFILLMPYFKPGSFQYIAPTMDTIFNGLKIAAAITVIILYTKNVIIRRRNISFIICILIWQLFMVFSAYINGKNLQTSMINAATIVSLCMLVDNFIKENAHEFFNSLFYLIFILVITNFIGIILYPDGVATTDYYYYPVNFLNIDNLLSPILILGVVISVIHIWYERKRALSYLLIIVSVLTTIMLWSATGVVGMLCFAVLILLLYHRFLREILTPFVLYLGMVVMNILIVFLRVQNLFAKFITDFLGKDINLTGRTEMWNQAIKMIEKKFLLGYGPAVSHGYVFWKNKFYYTHNGVLEILIQGGIISLIPFIMMIALTGIGLYRYRSNKVSAILLAGILANFVTLLTEAFITQISIYVLFSMAVNIENIISQMQYSLEKENHIKVVMPVFRIHS